MNEVDFMFGVCIILYLIYAFVTVSTTDAKNRVRKFNRSEES